MKRHEPGVVWSLRKDRKDYVRTTEPQDGKAAGIFAFINGSTILMSRADARLLARRIDQLLKATAK